MKKIILITLLVSISVVCTSQIKLHSNGNVSVGTTVAPTTHNTIYLYGPRLTFGGYNNNFFKFDCSATDARWWSSTSKIVFYNTEGNTHCTVEAKQFIVASDERYKTNISDIDNALDKVLKLEGVSYNWKATSSKLKSGTTPTPTFGFIAQNVESVIPEVVVTDSAGYKAMDYLGVIPYLVESIKELDKKIETQAEYIQDLEAQVNYTVTNSKSYIEQKNSARLFANQPNPFSAQTSIGYFVPLNASSAAIAIYDLNGKQILLRNIVSFGAGQVTVKGGELYSGIFLYSLLVDGVEVETKRMVVQ